MNKLLSYILRLVLRALPFAYMGLIWYLSSYPSDAVVNTGLSYDRMIKESLHLIEFGILYFLWVLALLTWDKLTPKTIIIFALLSGAYGLMDEIHQYFVPSRSATVIDFIKDITGVFFFWFFVVRKYNRQDSNSKKVFDWIKSTAIQQKKKQQQT